MEDLELCPFCESKNVQLNNYWDFAKSVTFYWIHCRGCGINTGEYINPEEVIRLWNRRPESEKNT